MLPVNDPVVVSPHMDDAVLSAAVQLMRPGARVVTACAGMPPEGTPLATWDRLTGAASAASRVRERYAEDDAALSTLGVGAITRLGFPDDQHVANGDRPRHEALVAALRPLISGAAEVWAPAGIGCHPDHLAVRDAAVAAADPAAVVHHYADVPYSVRYGWPSSVTGRPAASAFLDVEAWLAEELGEAGLDGSTMTRTVHELSPDDQRRKVAAMACYATQIPALDYGDALSSGDPAVVGFEVSWSRS